MSRSSDDRPNLRSSSMPELEMSKHAHHKDAIPGMDLWTEGLICAFEYVRGRRKLPKTKAVTKSLPTQNLERDDLEKQASTHRDTDAYVQNGVYNPESLYLMSLEPDNVAHLVDRDENLAHQMDQVHENLTHQMDQVHENRWVPIGWKRISELVRQVQAGTDFSSMEFEFSDKENDVTVAELAAPYWERPAGPVWWSHVDAGHPHSVSWLSGAQWLHPAVSVALRDESRLISERMKFLLYEVPVRVAGGLLFELLGQSAGDPSDDEDDIPVVLRSWQAQNFLVTAMHVKGSASNVNVLGVMEVQELLAGGGYNAPKTAHELIGHLASRLARWDDRFYRKYIFGAADETELMFVNRRNHEDMHLFGVILNQEVKKLSRQVIRVKWSLHAREEIIFELLQQLRGNAVRTLLEEVRRSTREMIDEQEAVRGRLFTIQDVMQSSIRAWLQDRSLQVTHNLTVFGGCGLVLTVITGLFGINVDGMPGAQDTPYAFALFTGLLTLLGIILIVFGIIYLGLKQPVSDAEVEVRKLELEEVVKMFQHEAETHAQVRHRVEQPSLGTNVFPHAPNYVIIQ